MVKITKGMTVDEVMKQLESDPEFAHRKAERERELRNLEAQSRETQTPLLQDLASVGVNVGSVWELVNTQMPYPKAVPILLDHLRRPYPDGIREGIARALAVREARGIGWRVLVDEFRKVDSENKRLKDALAVALSGTVDDNVISELVSLAKDNRHGSSRILLLRGIRRSRRREARDAINELAGDPVLKKEINSWNRDEEQ